jgi:hypothetical protein
MYKGQMGQTAFKYLARSRLLAATV